MSMVYIFLLYSKEVIGVSEKSDFLKLLRSLGGVPLKRGKKHNRWKLGADVIFIPNNFSGMRTYRNYVVAVRKSAARQGLAE